ncbi:putative DNA-directed RNA polymerase, partial [Daphnia magna]
PLYTCKLKIKPAFIEVISETIQIVKLCSICKIVNVSVRQYLKEQLPRDFIQGLPTASRAVINIDDTRKPHR